MLPLSKKRAEPRRNSEIHREASKPLCQPCDGGSKKHIQNSTKMWQGTSFDRAKNHVQASS